MIAAGAAPVVGTAGGYAATKPRKKKGRKKSAASAWVPPAGFLNAMADRGARGFAGGAAPMLLAAPFFTHMLRQGERQTRRRLLRTGAGLGAAGVTGGAAAGLAKRRAAKKKRK